ncbi:hypothetical protein [Streptomyces lanatus]|uniref:Uncharacterized protein n=1 Tax=Streptomyces lanatus TaxID=66900 RepID=A0ABV1XRN4_9ACTN|nr:hypothetical protein [Streptomyces lanatus]GHH05354.1 hypothetical protein GCM10018780_36780 [Streptomyces lanatus]
MVLERAAVHGVHDSDGRAVVAYPFEPLQPCVVLVEPSLDALDACAERDQFRAVLARRFDQGVEHGDDGPAEDVGDALVDAVVEGADLSGSRVIHRLCAGQVLHVEEVDTYLTCDFAVAEEHGDVEDGSAGEDRERLGA